MAPTKRAYDVLKNKRTIELMASKLENGNIVFIRIKVIVMYSAHVSDCFMESPLSTMVSRKDDMRVWGFTEKASNYIIIFFETLCT